MWISRKKLNELKNMVLDHERDLKEQLEVNRRMQKEINDIKAFLKISQESLSP